VTGLLAQKGIAMWKWLKSPEIKWWQIAILFIVIPIANFIISVSGGLLMHAFGVNSHYAPYLLDPDRVPEWLGYIFTHAIFVLFAFETLVFVALPLDCAVRRYGPRGQLLVALAACVVFGHMHGGGAQIAQQGLEGLVFCYVYLKTGGWKGRMLFPLTMTTIVHSLNDYTSWGLVYGLKALQAAL
jgi:membrane protease YdiL (CAAX protease family)